MGSRAEEAVARVVVVPDAEESAVVELDGEVRALVVPAEEALVAEGALDAIVAKSPDRHRGEPRRHCLMGPLDR